MPLALVYDKTRKNAYAFIPWYLVEKLFKPNELKIYVDGKVKGLKLQVFKRVADEEW